MPDVDPGRLLDGLLEQWPGYVAYVASYLYVAVIWLNHKAAFVRVHRLDHGLHVANLAVLFVTALLPFATAVASQALQRPDEFDRRVAVAFYALVGALLCASWWGFFHYLGRHGDLVRGEVDDAYFQGERLRTAAGVLLYAVAGILGYFLDPLIALGVFVALPLFYGATSTGLYETRLVNRG